MNRTEASRALREATTLLAEKQEALHVTPAHPSAFIKNPARFMAQREYDTAARLEKAARMRLEKAEEKERGLKKMAAAAVDAAEANLTVGAELTKRIAAEVGRRLGTVITACFNASVVAPGATSPGATRGVTLGASSPNGTCNCLIIAAP